MKRNIIAALVLAATVIAVYGYIRMSQGTGPGVVPPGGPGSVTPPAVPESREVDLFFGDTTGRRLSLERREVTGESRDDLLRRTVEELIRGPMDEDRMRTLPEKALVRAVYSREGMVWVDLGGSVQEEHPGGSWTEVLAVYSIVNTLVENFGDVTSVQILLNGRESETFAGHVDISKPLESRVQLLAGDWE